MRRNIDKNCTESQQQRLFCDKEKSKSKLKSKRSVSDSTVVADRDEVKDLDK